MNAENEKSNDPDDYPSVPASLPLPYRTILIEERKSTQLLPSSNNLDNIPFINPKKEKESPVIGERSEESKINSPLMTEIQKTTIHDSANHNNQENILVDVDKNKNKLPITNLASIDLIEKFKNNNENTNNQEKITKFQKTNVDFENEDNYKINTDDRGRRKIYMSEELPPSKLTQITKPKRKSFCKIVWCLVICLIIGSIIGPVVVCKTTCLCSNDCTKPLSPSALDIRQKSDSNFEQIKLNKTAEEIKIIESPPIDQILNKNASIIYRWFPKFETVSYWIEVSRKAEFTSTDTNSTTKSESNTSNYTDEVGEEAQNTSLYNIDIITADTDINFITFFLLINNQNLTYNLTDLLMKNSTSALNETSNNSKLDNSSINNNSLTKFNLIICNASRVGKVISCLKPKELDASYFMIAMNALDQFLPILNKIYLNIYNSTALSSETRRRVLQETDKIQSNTEAQKVEGVYGGDYTKTNDLFISNSSINSSNGSNESAIQLQTSYKQNSLGGGVNLSTDHQEFGIEKTSDLDPITLSPTTSEVKGSLNITANKNHTIDGLELEANDTLCDNITTNFTVSLKMRKDVEILTENQVQLVKNLSLLITFEEILNPIENNTIYANMSQNKEVIQQRSSRVLQSQQGNLLFTHRQNLFKKNIIGLDVYGYVEISCFTSDLCYIEGGLYLVFFYIPLYDKWVKVKITQTINVYKAIQARGLHVINGLTLMLNSTSFSLKTNFNEFIGKNKDFIKSFVGSIDQTIERYTHIFTEVSQKFSSLGGFVEEIISIALKEYNLFVKNHYNSILSNELLLDFVANSIESTISELQCSIKSNVSSKTKALAQIPVIYKKYSEIFYAKLDQLNATLNGGVLSLLQIKIDEIIKDFLVSKGVDQAVSTIVSDFIGNKINPYFSKWTDSFSRDFIDGKIRVILKFVQNADFINRTLDSYTDFLQDNTTICDYNQTESTQRNIDDLLSEEAIAELVSTSEFEVKTQNLFVLQQETLDFFKETLTNGMEQLMEGIKVTISDSAQTFQDIYNFANLTLTNSSNFIQNLMKGTFNDFDKFVNNLYQIVRNDIMDAEKLFQDVFNVNYQPTAQELAEIDPDIFKISQIINNYFNKFKAMSDIFNDLMNYFKSLFSARRILQKKRNLGSISNTIFNPAFQTIVDKFQELGKSLINSKTSIINIASSFNQVLVISEFSFDSFQIDINDIFSFGQQTFSELLENNLVSTGEALLLNEINSVFNLNDKFKSILLGLLPQSETPLIIDPFPLDFSQQFRLLTIPIIIGTVDVDFFLTLKASFQINWGFSGGEVYIKAILSVEIGAGITCYAEILIIRFGIYIRVDFFKGSLFAKMGLNLQKWKFFIRVELDASALGFAIGAYIQMIIFKIKWWCFTIDFWFFCFRICLPYFILEWSDWWILYEFGFVLFPLKMLLVDKYLPLIP